MLKVTIGRNDAAGASVDLLALPVFAGRKLGPGGELLGDLEPALRPVLEANDFTGKNGQALRVPTLGRLPAATVLFVGVGAPDEVTPEILRQAAAEIVKHAGGARKAVTTLAQALPGDPAVAVRAVTEGLALAAYRFDRYKAKTNGSRPASGLSSVVLAGAEGWPRDIKAAVASGAVRAAATNLARDLSNTPANDLHPADLAALAERAVAGKSVVVTVKDEKALAAEGYGGILGVGKGAADPPRLVELRYTPDGASRSVVLVGKGITFDSGGLSLKPADSMASMKTDMSGAAAVVGVLSACADLGVKVNVTGFLATAENMPSGTATRPGDVLKMRNGKTVEVLNTDAEGRLVLADALVDAAAMSPDAIVDIATLTGACVVALGAKYTGLMSNDAGLAAELLGAAERAGEPTWQLPLPDVYRKDLESEVADLKNIGGGRYGGAIVAGLFLKEFVDGKPWAHLDIAGPSRNEADDGYTPKGSTGTAVRTLLTWLEGQSG